MESKAAILQVVRFIVVVVVQLINVFFYSHSLAATDKAGDVLINWRSSMGKEGIVIVTKALRAGEISEDDASSAAAFLLEGFSFFYENPTSTVSYIYYSLIFSSITMSTSKTKEGFEGASLRQRSVLT